MLEKQIIANCAPTLAGLKTANMFNYKFSTLKSLYQELEMSNQTLEAKGLYTEVLKITESRALIYVYRKKRLQNDLRKEGVFDLLKKYGYHSSNLADCLAFLKIRLQKYDCFPHEIGIFLDYPLSDVIGFIKHGGKNCKCCGIWKVYSNECETKQLFARFKKCTDVYIDVFTRGRSLTELTVAA